MAPPLSRSLHCGCLAVALSLSRIQWARDVYRRAVSDTRRCPAGDALDVPTPPEVRTEPKVWRVFEIGKVTAPLIDILYAAHRVGFKADKWNTMCPPRSGQKWNTLIVEAHQGCASGVDRDGTEAGDDKPG